MQHQSRSRRRLEQAVRDPDGSIRTVSSARLGRGMRWRARYVDDNGQEHTKAFTRKTAAQIVDTDLDDVANRLDTAIRSAAYPLRTGGSKAGQPANG